MVASSETSAFVPEMTEETFRAKMARHDELVAMFIANTMTSEDRAERFILSNEMFAHIQGIPYVAKTLPTDEELLLDIELTNEFLRELAAEDPEMHEYYLSTL